MTTHTGTERINTAFGTAFMVAGGVLAGLIFLDRCTTIGLPLPSVWYRSRSMHVLVCAGFFILGWWAHRQARLTSPSNDDRPVFRTVRVYSKSACSLCDQALDVLQVQQPFLPNIEIVDITKDPELEQLHREHIPVVEIDGRIRFRGIVSPVLLERLVMAARNRAGQNNTGEMQV